MYGLTPFLADDAAIGSFLKMLSEYRIELIVVDPAESLLVKMVVPRTAALSARLRLRFDDAGWLIYSVDGVGGGSSSSE